MYHQFSNTYWKLKISRLSRACRRTKGLPRRRINQILTLILGITIVVSLLVSFELLPKRSIIISAIVPGIVLTILIRKQKENNNEKRLPETVSKNTKNSTLPFLKFFYLGKSG